MDAPVVGFAGMTHLGIVSAAAMAARGFDVVGYDPDESLTARLDRHDLPVLEPDLDRPTAANRERICFTDDVGDLARCAVVYIAADVPTDHRPTTESASSSPTTSAISPAARSFILRPMYRPTRMETAISRRLMPLSTASRVGCARTQSLSCSVRCRPALLEASRRCRKSG